MDWNPSLDTFQTQDTQELSNNTLALNIRFYEAYFMVFYFMRYKLYILFLFLYVLQKRYIEVFRLEIRMDFSRLIKEIQSKRKKL